MDENRQWLVGYLNQVLALEVECYSVKALDEQLKSMRIDKMDVPGEFVPPDKPHRPDPPADPPLPTKHDNTPIDTFWGAVEDTWDWFKEAAILVAVVSGIVGLGFTFYWATAWFIPLFLLIGLAGAFVGHLGVGLLREQSARRDLETEYSAALRDHEVKVRQIQLEYEARCRNMLTDYQKHHQALQQTHINEKNESLVNNQLADLFNPRIGQAQSGLKDRLTTISSLLNSLYDMDVLYPKYRNLVAVSSIAEYLDSGRCSELGDAYNIYEEERRLDRIIEKLDVVIYKLDQIKDMQYRLYVELVQVNDHLTALQASINEGFQVLKAQTAENVRRISELSDGIVQVGLDIEQGFREVDEYLTKLDKTSDKALAYLAEQRK